MRFLLFANPSLQDRSLAESGSGRPSGGARPSSPASKRPDEFTEVIAAYFKGGSVLASCCEPPGTCGSGDSELFDFKSEISDFKSPAAVGSGISRTTRKPWLLYDGALLSRDAERQKEWLMYQLPPRITRGA